MSRTRVIAIALTLVAVLVCAASFTAAHTAEEWKSRSIYQIITDRFSLPPPNNSTAQCTNIHTYCGGTWSGIESRLDYVQSLGFNAIWISPVPANVPNAFHGYAVNNLFELNPYFGTQQDFVNLITACHKRDVWVMVDVVANHMAGVNFQYGQLQPFNESQYYHDCNGCDSECNIPQSAFTVHNATVIEHCQLEGLSDLNQDQPYVRATLLDWIDGLVHNYSIDGLRIDTTPEVKAAFWSEWQARAGVYAFGEVFDQEVAYVAQYQGPLNATLSYPLFFEMRDVFAYGNPMTNLWSLYQQYDQYFSDPTILGTFVDNHDNARYLNLTTDSATYKNALTYTLTSRGVPIVYYGTEQGFHGATDPYDREPLWPTGYGSSTTYFPFIQRLNAWRAAGGWQGEQIMLNVTSNTLAYARGNSTLCVVTNAGQYVRQVNVAVSGLSWWQDGQQLTNIFDSSDVVLVKGGRVSVTLSNGLPAVYTTLPMPGSSTASSSAAPPAVAASSSSSTGAKQGVENAAFATAGVGRGLAALLSLLGCVCLALL